MKNSFTEKVSFDLKLTKNIRIVQSNADAR